MMQAPREKASAPWEKPHTCIHGISDSNSSMLDFTCRVLMMVHVVAMSACDASRAQ
jgi:hypothetical protein